MKTWTTEVIGVFDDDAYFIRLPDDLLEQVGWKNNDSIKWVDNNDGSYTLIKVEK